MKLQSSIEFIILLSAVAIFMLFVVSQYAHIRNTQQALFAKIANYSVQSTGSNTVFSYNNSLYLGLVVPNVTYVNKSSNVQIVLSYPGRYRINYLSLSAVPNGTILPSIYSGLNYSNINVLSFSFVPSVVGTTEVMMNANITVQNRSFSREITSFTYSEQQSTNSSGGGGPYYSAYISNRNESLLYPLSAPNNITLYGAWQHCNFLDNPGNEVYNCGANNYGVLQYDIHCQDYAGHWNTRYMWDCFTVPTSNYSVRTISPTQSYSYRISLNIKNNTSSLHSNLSSLSANSPLTGKGGRNYGYSIVNNVSGQSALPSAYRDYVVLANLSNYYSVNKSNYDNYTRNSSQLMALLQQYNGHVVAPDDNPNNHPILNAIFGNFAGADYWFGKIVQSPAQKLNGCGGILSQSNTYFYSCSPVVPFYYNITATLTGKNPNMTLLAQGSVIVIR